jgi:hypothetical protein
MQELTISRDQFDRGFLTWGGACCTRLPYKLIRELPDGRLLVRGRPSQEPANETERRTVEMGEADRVRAESKAADNAAAGKPVGPEGKHANMGRVLSVLPQPGLSSRPEH